MQLKILGIETATKATSVALCNNGKILGEITANTQKVHSKTLAPMIVTLLDLVGENLKDIDVFAVSGGPGSFMGLRIGLSIAKGFAVVENKPIAVVPTLRGLAENTAFLKFERVALVCATLDARCSNVYAGVWKLTNENFTPLCANKLICVTELETKLSLLKQQLNLPLILVGNGLYNSQLAATSIVFSESNANPRATSICKLAENRKFWYNAATATPIYLKNL